MALNLPNFRPFVLSSDGRPLLYRSARQENLTESDVEAFVGLEINTIVDLRSSKAYRQASGRKLLDGYYQPTEVDLPYSHKKDTDLPTLSKFGKKRLFFPFISWFYKIASCRNILPRLLICCLLLLDCCTCFQFHFIKRYIVKNYLNRYGPWYLYVSFFKYSGASICGALQTVASPEHVPALINCHQGKDRTGVTAALILMVLGKSREEIREDFNLSERGLDTIRDEIRRDLEVVEAGMSEEILHAKSEDIDKALDAIEEEFGSIQDYLSYIGFDRTWQERLRNNLQ